MTAPFRYRRLSYVALDVTDLAASRDFYHKLVGLTVDREDKGQLFLRCSDTAQDVILSQGETAGVRRLAFELESRADLDAAYAYLEEEGFAPRWLDAAETKALEVEAGLRFVEPATGLQLEYHVDIASRDAFEPTHAHIARLGHVVLNVTDFDAAYASLVGKLNFLESDGVPGRIAFMRCFPNRLHHSLALIKGPADGYNHANFMVSDIDDIGRAMNRMRKAEVPIVFGPGRHLPSGSIFLYFLDPDGMTTEYSFGMEEFEEEGARPPRVLDPKPEVLDTWGGLPDPRFGKTGAILGAHA